MATRNLSTSVSMSTFLLVMALGCGSTPDEWNTSRTEGVSNGPTAAQNGLLGTYFDNGDFTNHVLERVDSTVDFNWGSGSPDSTLGANSFSVRWTGFVRAEFSETYTFYTVSDDGVRLWVNDQLVIDNWTDHAPREDKGTITLEAGKVYSIKMEFYENGGGAVAKLLWSSSSVAKQVIPGERLVTQLESESEQHCVQANENSPAALTCPSGQTITSIDFASYGLPTGACDAGFEVGTCHATSSKSNVEASCLNQQSCNVLAKNTVFGDPCPGKYKNIAVVFTCSGSQTEDKCPQDPNKTEPGECGCGVPEGSCSGPIITASAENTRAGETKEKAFDAQASTKWLAFADAAWIQYDYPGDASKVITQYSITSANDHPERDPRDWKLLGSNDGTQFTTVDERSGEAFSVRFQKKTFVVSSPGSFKMYRLDVTSNFNPPAANSTQLAEIELMEGTATDECPSDPNKTSAGICGCGTPDTDSDTDGTADCNDNCANDPEKIEPGSCGCGKAEGTCPVGSGGQGGSSGEGGSAGQGGSSGQGGSAGQGGSSGQGGSAGQGGGCREGVIDDSRGGAESRPACTQPYPWPSGSVSSYLNQCSLCAASTDVPYNPWDPNEENAWTNYASRNIGSPPTTCANALLGAHSFNRTSQACSDFRGTYGAVCCGREQACSYQAVWYTDAPVLSCNDAPLTDRCRCADDLTAPGKPDAAISFPESDFSAISPFAQAVGSGDLCGVKIGINQFGTGQYETTCARLYEAARRGFTQGNECGRMKNILRDQCGSLPITP